MKFCNECISLQERLSRANDQYVSLLLQQERMARDGYRETWTFGVIEDALRDAENVWRSVARLLMAHRGTHESGSTVFRHRGQISLECECAVDKVKAG